MAYKLTYFDMRGRAEPIRILFALAKVKFVDNRINPADWPALKGSGTLPWGQIPVLEYNGKVVGQSMTIARYVARKFKLQGADDWEAARCDELVDACTDLVTEWGKWYFQKDEAQKAEAKKNLQSTVMPKYLGKMNTIQLENGGSFMVGKEITWADVILANFLERLEDSVDKTLLNSYPALRKMKDAVFNVPEIKAYVDKRPVQSQ